MITAGWIILVLFAFGFGMLTGLYVSSHSVSTAKHRQPVNPRPVLMPGERVRLDDRLHLSQEGLDEFQRDFKEAMDRPHSARRINLLRDYVDNNSTVEEMEKGHWEGLSGDLKPEPEPKILRPEETSSSLLGLSQGEIRPTAGLKPVFGETEHLEYDPEDYEEPLICQPCKRPLVKGETFWTVALPEEGEGVFIPICDECEAKSHG